MYRIMLPKGRLVETSEILFVTGDSEDRLHTSDITQSTGLVFKSTTGKCWWIGNIDVSGAFGSSVGSIWNLLLTKGYAGFSAYQFNSNISAKNISEPTYFKLLQQYE